MSQHATASARRSFVVRVRPEIFLSVLFLTVALSAPAQAQSIDCYASLEAYKLSNPELHCTCASATSSPSCGGSTSAHGSMPTLTTKQMMRLTVGTTVVDAFVNMLLSNNSQANAQKQKMMAELAKRKAEAEQQHRLEEAKRLALICRRLENTLKLTGLPGLKLKSEDSLSGGLQLKLTDNPESHAGIRGLPGIALNDNTGNGGNTPYGINGLPGIYTNGSGSGRGTATSGESKLQLKTGDAADQPVQITSVIAATAIDPTASAGVPPSAAVAVIDPLEMTPQQLADLAMKINSLPAEEQERLMNAAATPNTQGTSDVVTTEPSVGQLQQVANASQQAARASDLDTAAAKARTGFDQATGGALTPPHPQTSTVQSAPPGTTTPSQTTTGSTNGTRPQGVRGSVQAPTQMSSVDVGAFDPAKPHSVALLSSGAAGRATGCPVGSIKKLPTREELARELAGLRFKLNVLKSSLSRLNRSIQMDQEQFAEWEKETQDAVDRSKEQLKEAISDRVQGRFFDYAKAHYAGAPAKLNAVKHVEVLLNENDVYDWADKGGKSWEQFGEGLTLLGDNLPLTENAKDVLWASKNMIDSAFEISTELVSWRRISQLQKNSDAYLAAVSKSGAQMKQIVTRIRDIEDRLATGSYASGGRTVQPNAPACE